MEQCSTQAIEHKNEQVKDKLYELAMSGVVPAIKLWFDLQRQGITSGDAINHVTIIDDIHYRANEEF